MTSILTDRLSGVNGSERRLGEPIPHERQGETILLTGSTGHLGSYILNQLLSHDGVLKVYVYNRTSKRPSRDRQAASFADRGLPLFALDSPKLEFLEGELSDPSLGISEDVYERLCREVTSIVHNAWRVDFTIPLIAFEPNVKGTRNLVELALSRRTSGGSSGAKLLFVSSVGAVQGWDPERGPVPEEVFEDASVALGNGYGESKHICERVSAIHLY